MVVSNGSHAKPNILIFGVDSLRAPNLSCYGYPRLTSPHIDQLAAQGTLFENTFSAHIPTTSGYTSMLSGLDVFSSQVVALRHQGPSEVRGDDAIGASQGCGLQHGLCWLERKSKFAWF